jgi:uncharacterized protein YmfQ (DUF2313 family)
MPLYGFPYGEAYGYTVTDFYGGEDNGSIDDGQFDVINDDYVPVIHQLLPKGRAWIFRPDGIAEKVIRALSWEPSRVERRARQLLSEFDPRTTEEMIGDWEELLDLTDPPTDLADRRLAAYTKFTKKFVGNEPFFLAMANSLGYPSASIRHEGDPFTCVSDCTDSLRGFEGYWLDTWTLVTGGTTANDDTLEDLVNKYKQSQEIVLFEYP